MSLLAPDAVDRARAKAKKRGLLKPDSTLWDKAKTVGILFGEYGNSIKDAVTHDVGIMGKGMRGEATPAQVTSSLLRSYVGPTAGAGLLSKQAPNQVRMFIGESAKTFDKAAKVKADNMLKAGASRDDVWKETGTMKGVDGKWRQEISDKYDITDSGEVGASLNAGADSFIANLQHGDSPSITQKMAMDHPELYQNYPELKAMRLTPQTGEGGTYRGNIKGISINREDLAKAAEGSKLQDIKNVESVNLHELQHAIQDKEGFARGGSPDEFIDTAARNSHNLEFAKQKFTELQKSISDSPAYLENESAIQKALSVNDMAALRPLIAKRREFMNTHPELKNTADEIAYLTENPGQTPHEQYRALAGETEARNVQARMNMDAVERRAIAPWKTQDVPDEQQIVQMGSGVSRHITDKGEKAIRDGFSALQDGKRIGELGVVGELTDNQFHAINRELKKVGLNIKSKDLSLAKDELIHIYKRRVKGEGGGEKYEPEQVITMIKTAFSDAASVMNNNGLLGSTRADHAKLRKGLFNGLVYSDRDNKNKASIKTVFRD